MSFGIPIKIYGMTYKSLFSPSRIILTVTFRTIPFDFWYPFIRENNCFLSDSFVSPFLLIVDTVELILLWGGFICKIRFKDINGISGCFWSLIYVLFTGWRLYDAGGLLGVSRCQWLTLFYSLQSIRLTYIFKDHYEQS